MKKRNSYTWQESEWVADTISYRAIPVKDFFCKYVANNFGIVRMGDTSYSKIVGIGDIYIKTNSDAHWF